jgi:hypothetical protein
METNLVLAHGKDHLTSTHAGTALLVVRMCPRVHFS